MVRYKDRHKEARLGTEEEPESDWGRPTGSKPPADTERGAGGSPHRNGVFRRYHSFLVPLMCFSDEARLIGISMFVSKIVISA